MFSDENNRSSRRRNNTILNDAGVDQPAGNELTLDEARAVFLRAGRVKNLSDETIKYYENCLTKLDRIAGEISLPAVDRADIERFITDIQTEGLSDSSVNMYIRGWRAFFNFLFTEGLIPADVGKFVKPIKAEKRIIETFSKDQIKRLLAVPDKTTFTGYRNYVAMMFLLDTGVRISELIGIKTTDIRWSERIVRVKGKNRKERYAPYQSTLERHLKAYEEIRGMLDHDYLFVNIDNKPLAVRSLQEDIADYGVQAGIKGVRVSPHTFRHTFSKMYIMAGGDIYSLQKILGHTSLEMVRNYVNLFGVDIVKKHRQYSPLDRLYEDGEE